MRLIALSTLWRRLWALKFRIACNVWFLPSGSSKFLREHPALRLSGKIRRQTSASIVRGKMKRQQQCYRREGVSVIQKPVFSPRSFSMDGTRDEMREVGEWRQGKKECEPRGGIVKTVSRMRGSTVQLVCEEMWETQLKPWSVCPQLSPSFGLLTFLWSESTQVEHLAEAYSLLWIAISMFLKAKIFLIIKHFHWREFGQYRKLVKIKSLLNLPCRNTTLSILADP